MKKSILLILILMMLLSLTSCGSKEEKCPDGMTCNNLDKWIGVEKTLDKDTYDGDVFFVGEDLEAGTYFLSNSKGMTQVLVYKNRESYASNRVFNRYDMICPTCVIGNYWSTVQQEDDAYVFLEDGNLVVFYGDRCDFTKYDPLSNGILYSGTYSVPASISPGNYNLISDVVLPGFGIRIWGDMIDEGVMLYIFENAEDYFNFLRECDGNVENADRELVEHYVVESVLLRPEFTSLYRVVNTHRDRNITLNNGMVIVVIGGTIKITQN